MNCTIVIRNLNAWSCVIICVRVKIENRFFSLFSWGEYRLYAYLHTCVDRISRGEVWHFYFLSVLWRYVLYIHFRWEMFGDKNTIPAFRLFLFLIHVYLLIFFWFVYIFNVRLNQCKLFLNIQFFLFYFLSGKSFIPVWICYDFPRSFLV